MAWYRIGTVNVTNNSSTVIGTGTAWVQAAAVGESFLGPDERLYEITAINSNTSLTISPAYKGSTSTAQNYALVPTQGYLRDLAAAAANLVQSYAAVKDGAGQGKFAAGTNAAPSLRGAADEDTGLNLKSGNQLALVTGGVERLAINASGVPSGTSTAHLLNRANHTGTQTIATVEGLSDALSQRASWRVLQVGEDLNALTGPGFYYIGNTGDAQTILNRPEGVNVAFGVMVVNTGGLAAMRIRQEVCTYSSTGLPQIYVRNRNGSTFSSWFQVDWFTSAYRSLIDNSGLGLWIVNTNNLTTIADKGCGFFAVSGNNVPIDGGGYLAAGPYVLAVRDSGGAGWALNRHITESNNTVNMYRVKRDGAGGYIAFDAITLLHSKVTTVDSNGFIKQASPIINVYDNRIEKNDTREVAPVQFEREAQGVYLLTDCPPLSDDGWYLEQPRDRNGQVYHNVEWRYDDEKQVLRIETFERVWNPVTGQHENGLPVDIQAGRFIALRFKEDPGLYPDPDADQQEYSEVVDG